MRHELHEAVLVDRLRICSSMFCGMSNSTARVGRPHSSVHPRDACSRASGLMQWCEGVRERLRQKRTEKSRVSSCESWSPREPCRPPAQRGLSGLTYSFFLMLHRHGRDGGDEDWRDDQMTKMPMGGPLGAKLKEQSPLKEFPHQSSSEPRRVEDIKPDPCSTRVSVNEDCQDFNQPKKVRPVMCARRSPDRAR